MVKIKDEIVSKEEHYQLYYDDSSDEENEQDSLQDSFAEKYTTFQEVIKTKILLVDRFPYLCFSFINATFGLMVYHATKVRQIYKQWKLSYLKNKELPSEEVIAIWLREAFKNTITLSLEVIGHPNASKILSDDCMKELSETIEETIKVGLPHKRALISARSNRKTLPRAFVEQLTLLQTRIESFVDNAGNYSKLEKKHFTPPLSLTADNLFAVKEIRQWAELTHLPSLNEIAEIHSLLVSTKKETKLFTAQGKISASSEASTVCDSVLLCNQQLTPIQKWYVNQIKGLRSRVDPDSFLTTVRETFLKNQLNDLIRASFKEGTLILQQNHIDDAALLPLSQFAPFASHMQNFIYCNKETFQQLQKKELLNFSLEKSLIETLYRSFCQYLEPYTFRMTLPSSFTHNINSPLEYLASLRLTTRSANRIWRNQHNEGSIMGNKEENIEFSWQFPASEIHKVNERTRITTKARSALVPIHTNANAYEGIISKIKCLQLRKYQCGENSTNITDQDIAHWIRQVLQCKPLQFFPVGDATNPLLLFPKQREDLISFIIHLAHLLGGTETMRYPGALIENQMALDLIIAGKLKWEEALNPNNEQGCFIPMTISGAVEVSRTLMAIYKKHNAYSYNYPGDETSDSDPNVTKFIVAETRLTKSWIQFLKEQDPKISEVDLDAPLRNAITKWYPGL